MRAGFQTICFIRKYFALNNKEKLLYTLEKERIAGRTLSGEDAAAQLGVSRVAVWKAVEALRSEGYPVHAQPSKGYELSKECDILSEPRIRAYLPSSLENLKIFTYGTVDSTNRQAKLLAGSDFPGNALFVADAQSEGRGRLGRSFYSPPGTGLYLSFLFSSKEPFETLLAVTPYAAVVSAQALERATGKQIGIKWVNDLYLDGKKICGILTEALTALDEGCEHQIVVGIGINLTTKEFPTELAASAGSVGTKVNRAALAADIAASLAHFCSHPREREFMSEYSRRSVVLGKKVRLNKWGEVFEGTVTGFDSNGGLLLDRGNGEIQSFTGGEISLRLAETSPENPDPSE